MNWNLLSINMIIANYRSKIKNLFSQDWRFSIKRILCFVSLAMKVVDFFSFLWLQDKIKKSPLVLTIVCIIGA